MLAHEGFFQHRADFGCGVPVVRKADVELLNKPHNGGTATINCMASVIVSIMAERRDENGKLT